MNNKYNNWWCYKYILKNIKQEFIIGGKRLCLTADQVVSSLRGVEPGSVQTHAVEIDGVTYPIKEALARVTGLDLLDFNTNQARSVFRRLGFKVVRVG
jgi:hypothetical protein